MAIRSYTAPRGAASRPNVFTMRLDSRESRSLGLGEASLLAVSSKSELAIGFEANDARTTLSRVPLAGGVAARGR